MNTRFIKFISFLLFFPSEIFSGTGDAEILKHKPEYLPGRNSAALDSLFIEGWRDAESDLLSGNPRYKIYGMPARWSGEFEDIMTQRFGVAVEFGGCVITEDSYYKSEGNNACIAACLSRIFGEFSFEDIWEEARKVCEAKPLPQEWKYLR